MNDDTPLTTLRNCLLFTPLILAMAGPATGKSIGKDQINIREQPNVNSTILFAAPLGYPIEIVEENGEWVRFSDWQNNNGWVYKPLVADIDTAVILVDNANIRSTPSLSGSVVSTVKLGEIYIILSKNNNWVKLGYYESKSPVGWIRNDLVFGE